MCLLIFSHEFADFGSTSAYKWMQKDYFSSPRVYFRMTARLYLEFVWDTYCKRCRWNSCHGTSCPWPDTPDSLHTQPCCTSHSCLQKSKKTNQVTLTISFYTPHYQHQLKIGKKNLMKECVREKAMLKRSLCVSAEVSCAVTLTTIMFVLLTGQSVWSTTLLPTSDLLKLSNLHFRPRQTYTKAWDTSKKKFVLLFLHFRNIVNT